MNVFEVLIDPEKEERQGGERATVCSAANVLQIGEFQFLRLAYRDWFGEDLPEALTDGLFTSYMLNNTVPHWARHYARSVLDEQATRGLEAHGRAWRGGVGNRSQGHAAASGALSFWLAAAVVAVTVAGVFLAAGLTTTASTSVLPPYFQGGELPRAPLDSAPAAPEAR